MKRKYINLKIHDRQLAVLRGALESGRLGGDACVRKALAARGFAVEDSHGFGITDAGIKRALYRADYMSKQDGVPFDKSMMEDL